MRPTSLTLPLLTTLCASLLVAAAPAPATPDNAPATAPAPAVTSLVVSIEDLVRRVADRQGAVYVLSHDAQGRRIELLRPTRLEGLDRTSLEQVFSAALTAMGLVLQPGRSRTRIAPAPMQATSQGGGDRPVVLAVADLGLVGLNRLGRTRRDLVEAGADVLVDHRAATLLALHDGDRVETVLQGMSDLGQPAVVVRVPAAGRPQLIKAVRAVLDHNTQNARRTWRRGGGGGIVASGGAAPASLGAPPPPIVKKDD